MSTQEWEELVDEALRAHALSCQRAEHEAWKFVVANGRETHGTARLADGWLLLDVAPGPAAAPLDFWNLLDWNGGLTGGAKFALQRDGASPRLRAELPLDKDIDLSARIRQACAGFTIASGLLAGVPHADDCHDIPDTRPDVVGLCGEAGWPFIERPSGPLAVRLDVGEAFHQAIVESEPGRVRLSVPLTTEDEPRPARCRAALGLLGLRASAAVRMARAAAAANGLRFEVVLAGVPEAAEIGHALAALSVACRLCAREASVLSRDETVAGHYLGTTTQPRAGQKEETP